MATQPKKTDEDRLFKEIHRLVTGTLADAMSPEVAELEGLLEDSEEARVAYTHYMHETSVLGTTSETGSARGHAVGQPGDERATTAGSTVTSKRSQWLLLAVAASFLLACVASWGGLHSATEDVRPTDSLATSASAPESDAPEGVAVATITRLVDVKWQAGFDPPEVLSRIETGQRLRLDSGQIELVFDAGVELLITGHADALVESPLKVVSTQGTFAARVREGGEGFTIDTPVTRVIDQGTAFGVMIDDSGETEVAVFEGAVDLDSARHEPHDTATPLKRLVRGEALKIGVDGRFSRVVSIPSGQFPIAGDWRGRPVNQVPLITNVSDNIRDPRSANFYQIVQAGLRDDAQAFADRGHEWNGLDENGLPDSLVGADYVMPFNNDKFTTGLEVTVSVAAACRFYVFLDNNMSAPEWLSRDFTDTGIDVGLDQAKDPKVLHAEIGVGAGVSVDNNFSVWERLLDGPTDVVLGHVEKPADKLRGWNMFGIAAAPLLAAEDVP